MSFHQLLEHPVWRAEDVGRPIPDSPHAVSLALPRWDDVVAYEEKEPRILDRLVSGYPRFVVHPLVAQLAHRLGQGRPCLPFPSRNAAHQAARYLGPPAQVVERDGLCGVVTTAAQADDLKLFWQHTGLIVSTRQAEAILTGRRVSDDASVRARLRSQLAAWYDCRPDDVFLHPTGMAAMWAALRAVKTRRPTGATIQLGFPYVDTLKIQQKYGGETHLLWRLDTVASELDRLLAQRDVSAVFCEVPGNPLLTTPDLRAVTPRLRARGVPLVADDVVATPINVDLSPHAALIATSLTKYVAGTGDVMGGALICNPRSPFYAELKPIIAAEHEELLWIEDAVILEEQAHSFPERMRQHNANGLWIAERLRAHPAIERVWFPKWESAEAYEALRRPGGGWSSLVTFLPRNADTESPRIYDRMEVCKGPSLGTMFSLACPFTLLAHYRELEWAESCGVSRYLIRLSVGLENPAELWRRLHLPD
ncbi:MAG: PLP-dependent transferase [Verrucomicrobiae bacterium]|nr:PLP-dependent transferase [Verrucomicrobiae bacterium]